MRSLRLLLAGLLGVGSALVVSCGASSGRLIPIANSEPLQRDFEEVAHTAEAGSGSCTATESALRKTEADFATLPSTLDAGLRRRLQEGITKLREDALGLCAQPVATATTATTPPRTAATTQTTPTTPTTAQTTTTPTTSSTTTPTTSGPGGGTVAPKEGEGEESPGGVLKGREPGASGGARAGNGAEGGK